jgi:hypothetical protein
MYRATAEILPSFDQLSDDDFLEEPDPWPASGSHSATPTPSGIQSTREGIIERLNAYSILPPRAERLSDGTLDGVEQVFVTCAELVDDDSRRRALHLIFGSETEKRATLLAIVPIFYDELFFDDKTPTRDLVELTLIAHAKWRKSLRLA